MELWLPFLAFSRARVCSKCSLASRSRACLITRGLGRLRRPAHGSRIAQSIGAEKEKRCRGGEKGTWEAGSRPMNIAPVGNRVLVPILVWGACQTATVGGSRRACRPSDAAWRARRRRVTQLTRATHPYWKVGVKKARSEVVRPLSLNSSSLRWSRYTAASGTRSLQMLMPSAPTTYRRLSPRLPHLNNILQYVVLQNVGTLFLRTPLILWSWTGPTG